MDYHGYHGADSADDGVAPMPAAIDDTATTTMEAVDPNREKGEDDMDIVNDDAATAPSIEGINHAPPLTNGTPAVTFSHEPTEVEVTTIQDSLSHPPPSAPNTTTIASTATVMTQADPSSRNATAETIMGPGTTLLPSNTASNDIASTMWGQTNTVASMAADGTADQNARDGRTAKFDNGERDDPTIAGNDAVAADVTLSRPLSEERPEPPPHTSLSEPPQIGINTDLYHGGLASVRSQVSASTDAITESSEPLSSMDRPTRMNDDDATATNGLTNMASENPNHATSQAPPPPLAAPNRSEFNSSVTNERVVSASEQEMSSYSDMEQQRQSQPPSGGMGMNNNSYMGQLQLSQPSQPMRIVPGGTADRSPQSVLPPGQHGPPPHNNSNMIMMPRDDMNPIPQLSLPPHLRNHPNLHYDNNNNNNNNSVNENRAPATLLPFTAGSPTGNAFGHGPVPVVSQQHQQQQQQQQHLEGSMGPGTPTGGGGGLRELRVEDALLYLDDVKREFKDRPAIYNEFLSIMKNFKSQEVDTPGVIDRVSKLFRGYNNLILGFNTFLPDGCKISLADLERADAQRIAEEQAAQLQAQIYAKVKKPKGPGAKRGPKPGLPALSAAKIQPGGGLRYVAHNPPGHMANGTPGPDKMTPGGHWDAQSPDGVPTPSSLQDPSRGGGQFGNQPMQGSPPPAQHQAVEFDHAISYVTTIKKRFASDPNTYHSFLEILHTYQKEQRGIKEVLEQVARLFQDHSDLLKEFAFFLPDAVQEQAKERLHRAVAESEARLAAQRQQQIDRFTPRPADNRSTDTSLNLSSDAKANRPNAVERQRAALQQPESFVYNSAVERQFFDSTRESLTSYSRDSGQAWAEFTKCLDMYAQEILSRTEMLNFVEPLLGKRNSNLFEEFKRILNSAGSPSSSTQLMDDAWYSVPLAEIDFGRCRRCSPSYRALPRDYPAPPCSDRSEEEAKVLNDVWVSLPVGSEESYTFRHMRRNTYEETLFRVEDERFEIDMVIDSNAATLQRLDPIAKEIALLAQEDMVPTDIGVKAPLEGAGLGGKRYQYTFDKKVLGVVHRNTIARIYGDNGQEMLDLLVRNPTVAIPLVVQRLRQKDAEWRAVRDRLNKHWKDLAEHNYYKSLDHRSLTWRTIDKRAISARTLVTEIKDRAANGGRESKEAYRQKLDKAKEEHGTFFEVTVGGKLTYELDLTFLPKPDRRLFTPHMTLNYKNVSWAQRDAYRILAFALERGTITPADKERCHRLWVEFLGPWFALSFNWMQKPAVTYQESTAAAAALTTLGPAVGIPSATIVSEDDEESLDEEPEIISHMVTEELQTMPADMNRSKEYTDHHPLPAGAQVSTLYGEGKIIEFRRADHVYTVRLGFGAIGYLRPATVLCSMLPVEKSAYTRQLRAEDRTKLARPNDQLAFGTQSLYLFFRLHEILVQRLNTAKRLAYSVGDDHTLQSMVEQMPNINPKMVGRRRYEAYLSLIYALLDGGVGGAAEGGKYEDRVRSLLGHHAFELATMDKLIAHIWKDVQTMANDDTMWSLIQLYRRHVLAGSFQPEAFRQEAAYLSDGEAMYAFQHCYLSNSDESVLHVEYLGIMDDGDDMDHIDTNMDEDMVATTMEQLHPPPPVTEAPANKRPKR